jgi:hypothetical protein
MLGVQHEEMIDLMRSFGHGHHMEATRPGLLMPHNSKQVTAPSIQKLLSGELVLKENMGSSLGC